MSRNKTKENVPSLEERQLLTTLYDCSLDLKLKIPRGEKRENMDRMYRSVLIAIAIEFVAKHEAYQGMTECVYNILRNTLSATRGNWRVANKKEWILNRNDKSAGNIMWPRPPRNALPIYDTVEHSGLVWKDNDGPVTLDCNLKLFLSPGVRAAQDIYDNHNFFVENFKEDKWNSRDFLDSWCHALEYKLREGSDFCGTWQSVLGNMEEYEEYWESKRIQYATTPERSSDEESDSEDD